MWKFWPTKVYRIPACMLQWYLPRSGNESHALRGVQHTNSESWIITWHFHGRKLKYSISSQCTGTIPACCSGKCADLISSTMDCGGCGSKVSPILPSAYIIPPNKVAKCSGVDPTCCTGVCSDLDSDIHHCGACDETPCLGIIPACCSGECTDIATDANHCGKCSTTVSGYGKRI
jgi:hypothetical protein